MSYFIPHIFNKSRPFDTLGATLGLNIKSLCLIFAMTIRWATLARAQLIPESIKSSTSSWSSSRCILNSWKNLSIRGGSKKASRNGNSGMNLPWAKMKILLRRWIILAPRPRKIGTITIRLGNLNSTSWIRRRKTIS